ncbi:MAG: prefoldin subunit alpha [Candidatus Aenigmarchaeota archaeon]|nr:prefoldin subunit alpha [Candidatus Aenigmarchaeota archaeon]
MDNKTEESQLQERYVQIELLNKQLEQISSQIGMLKMRIEELMSVGNAVEKASPGEGFSQIGTGVFIKSEFKDTDAFLINIGKNIFVKMNKKEALDFINRKIEDMKTIHSHLANRIGELQNEIQGQIQELQKIQK